jgi:hypothetical protein
VCVCHIAPSHGQQTFYSLYGLSQFDSLFGILWEVLHAIVEQLIVVNHMKTALVPDRIVIIDTVISHACVCSTEIS